MANRTPPSQWPALFNPFGGGLVHINLFTNVGYTLLGTRTFGPTNSEQQYTPTPGTVAIIAIAAGGGGGGGGAQGVSNQQAAGSGGNAGGYSACFEILDTSATYHYNVGSLGIGGAAGPNDGNPGGETNLLARTAGGDTIILLAPAGTGGIGGASGTTTTTTIPPTPPTGAIGNIWSGNGATATPGLRWAGGPVRGGNGGAHPWGQNGRGLSSTTGENATGFGAGGGAASENGATSRPGGDGAPGRLLILELA